MKKKKIIEMGLCKGRHNIPGIDNYIFGTIADPTDIGGIVKQCESVLLPLDFDMLILYVAGLAVALVEVVNYCLLEGRELTLMHYDCENDGYIPQKVFTLS